MVSTNVYRLHFPLLQRISVGCPVHRLSRLSGTMQAQLEAVRDRVAREIGNAACQRLHDGQPLAWGRSRCQVTLRREGLAFRPRRLPILHRAPVVVPYTTAFTMPTDSDNFYPGLALFKALLTQSGGFIL